MAAYDLIVVGLGAMGLSCLWHAAQRGMRVLGIDMQPVPNALGSSHGQSRAFRMAYFEHPGYVPLLRRALAGWQELERAAGQQLLLTCGGVYLGLPDSELIQGSLRAARLHGLDHELLDQSALGELWPQFACFEKVRGYFDKEAGVCLVEDSLRHCLTLAQQAGAELSNEELLEWQVTATAVELETNRSRYKTKQLVLCPGAYADGVWRLPGHRITPTRQCVGWFKPRRPELACPSRLPVWAAEFPDGQFWYGFGALPGSAGLKLGRHQAGAEVDPRRQSRELQPTEARSLADFAERWLPEDAGDLVASSVCLYENSADGHFVLDWHPSAQGRVLLLGGGSGHAFKFMPVLGELALELLERAEVSSDVSFLSLQRFAGS